MNENTANKNTANKNTANKNTADKNTAKKIKIQSPDTKLATVCKMTDSVEAELVRNTLLDHDIVCELDGEHQGGFTGTFEVGILVCETDLKKAREILAIHHPELRLIQE